MNVVGLDLSLTATGYADADAAIVVKCPKYRGAERLAHFRNFFARLWTDDQPHLIVVEGYAFGAQNAREVMGELGGVIRLLAYDMGSPVAVVQPKLLKKFATNSGNASKTNMILSAVNEGAQSLPPKRRTGEPEDVQFDDNAVDAWWLRQMGLAFQDGLDGTRWYGHQLAAARSVAWPEVVA